MNMIIIMQSAAVKREFSWIVSRWIGRRQRFRREIFSPNGKKNKNDHLYVLIETTRFFFFFHTSYHFITISYSFFCAIIIICFSNSFFFRHVFRLDENVGDPTREIDLAGGSGVMLY